MGKPWRNQLKEYKTLLDGFNKKLNKKKDIEIISRIRIILNSISKNLKEKKIKFKNIDFLKRKQFLKFYQYDKIIKKSDICIGLASQVEGSTKWNKKPNKIKDTNSARRAHLHISELIEQAIKLRLHKFIPFNFKQSHEMIYVKDKQLNFIPERPMSSDIKFVYSDEKLNPELFWIPFFNIKSGFNLNIKGWNWRCNKYEYFATMYKSILSDLRHCYKININKVRITRSNRYKRHRFVNRRLKIAALLMLLNIDNERTFKRIRKSILYDKTFSVLYFQLRQLDLYKRFLITCASRFKKFLLKKGSLHFNSSKPLVADCGRPKDLLNPLDREVKFDYQYIKTDRLVNNFLKLLDLKISSKDIVKPFNKYGTILIDSIVNKLHGNFIENNILDKSLKQSNDCFYDKSVYNSLSITNESYCGSAMFA